MLNQHILCCSFLCFKLPFILLLLLVVVVIVIVVVVVVVVVGVQIALNHYVL